MYKIGDVLVDNGRHVIKKCVVTNIIHRNIKDYNIKEYELIIIESDSNDTLKKGRKIIFVSDYLKSNYNYHSHASNDELMAMML